MACPNLPYKVFLDSLVTDWDADLPFFFLILLNMVTFFIIIINIIIIILDEQI